MRPIALFALLPLAAFAQTSAQGPATPPASAAPAAAPTAGGSPPPASWSIGAGVFNSSRFATPLSVLWVGGVFVSVPQMPSVSASLERRLSERRWAVFGVSGGFARRRQDVPPTLMGVTRNDATSLALSAGVRWVLTPAGAPVDVSALALADAGALRWELDMQASSTPATEVTGWFLGASAGLAVDRELGHGLSLRVATPLVGVTYASTRTRSSGEATLEGSDFSAGVELAPRLELRLAF